MAIRRFSNTSIRTGSKSNKFWDQLTRLPGFESIQTVAVTASGGQSEIDFSSIPSDFTHLQLRMFYRSSVATDVLMRFNGDTASNYKFKILRGDGSNSYAENYNGSTIFNTQITPYTSVITDIYDYRSTSINKVSRSIGGYDTNNTGEAGIWSHIWYGTPAAITSIKLSLASTGTFSQHSHFALYGIK